MLASWQSLAKMPAAGSPMHRINHRSPSHCLPTTRFAVDLWLLAAASTLGSETALLHLA